MLFGQRQVRTTRQVARKVVELLFGESGQLDRERRDLPRLIDLRWPVAPQLVHVARRTPTGWWLRRIEKRAAEEAETAIGDYFFSVTVVLGLRFAWAFVT